MSYKDENIERAWSCCALSGMSTDSISCKDVRIERRSRILWHACVFYKDDTDVIRNTLMIDFEVRSFLCLMKQSASRERLLYIARAGRACVRWRR